MAILIVDDRFILNSQSFTACTIHLKSQSLNMKFTSSKHQLKSQSLMLKSSFFIIPSPIFTAASLQELPQDGLLQRTSLNVLGEALTHSQALGSPGIAGIHDFAGYFTALRTGKELMIITWTGGYGYGEWDAFTQEHTFEAIV